VFSRLADASRMHLRIERRIIGALQRHDLTSNAKTNRSNFKLGVKRNSCLTYHQSRAPLELPLTLTKRLEGQLERRARGEELAASCS